MRGDDEGRSASTGAQDRPGLVSSRILVTHPSPDLYGSDRVLLETVSALAEQPGAVVQVAIPADGSLVPELRARGAEVVITPTPILRKSALSPRGMVRLAIDCLRGLIHGCRLIKRSRPQVVLVNTVTTPVWLTAAKFCRVPAVCHVHEAEGGQSSLIRRLLYAPLLQADRLIVNSQYSLNVMTRTWKRLRTRSVVLYNGVPGPAQAEAPASERPSSPRLLFLGRLSPRKGPDVALEALALLQAAGQPARLDLLGAVFPGYEWYEEKLRQRVDELGLTEQVRFLGFDPDIWPRLAGADIAVVPSTVDEPFGNTAVEAKLARRPLIVSATSGLKEAAAGYESAWFVEPGNPQDIADAVLEILEVWPELVERTARDAELAHQRHAPARYQSNIREMLRLTDRGNLAPTAS